MTAEDQTAIIGASAAGLLAARGLAAARRGVQVRGSQRRFAPEARRVNVTWTWLELLDIDPGHAVLNRTRCVRPPAEALHSGIGSARLRWTIGFGELAEDVVGLSSLREMLLA